VILKNNLVSATQVNRQFENQFVKIGTTLTIRKPNKFLVSSGPALQLQDISEPSTTITISNQRHVDFQFTTSDLTLTIEEFRTRYLIPAMAELANQVDYDVLGNFTSVHNIVGSPGTVPNAFSYVASVGQRLDENAAPQDGRVLVLGPAAYWSMATALTALYVQSVSEPALKGFLATIANFKIFEDQNIQSITVGNYSGTPVVSGSSQTGANLVSSGWTASRTGLLNAGDVITAAGCYAINPKSRQSTGTLQNFLVTSTVNSDSNGNCTIPIYPAITTSGAYQTVSASPTSGGTISVKTGNAATAYQNNLAFTRDCFGLVMVPIELPQGVDFAARETYDNISLAVRRAYDINNDVFPCRIDILYGDTCYYPELGCRLTN
jgi:hypothetical protein